MIISRIIGGLGNQMFQYATLRAIELRTGHVSKVDITPFENYGLHHGFELGRIFSQTPIKIASKSDIKSILGWRSSLGMGRIFLRSDMKLFSPKNYITEYSLAFQKEILNIADDSYLAGYWQSEKYFLDVADHIRKEFTFSESLSAENSKIKEEILSANSISLHIRRGDYVSNPTSLAIHGLCTIEYYQTAVAHIQQHVASPTYFIFSDDIPWVKANLGFLKSVVYVEHNKDSQSYNDMRLMSLCNHHIIANSSFSWWGAWLNASPNKIVISPRKWFADSSKHDIDLIPQSWVKL
jgi:hypothetical protein